MADQPDPSKPAPLPPTRSTPTAPAAPLRAGPAPSQTDVINASAQTRAKADAVAKARAKVVFEANRLGLDPEPLFMDPIDPVDPKKVSDPKLKPAVNEPYRELLDGALKDLADAQALPG